MKVLVTGSSGFIGAHLVAALREVLVEVIELDLRTGHDVLSCDLPDADLVYHLAAKTDATSASVDDAQDNVIGLLRLLNHYGADVVFASSSMINYPETPYAVSKLTGEVFCRQYGASVVRLCNVWGPGGHSVIEKFSAAETLVIYGSGEQRRTYASVRSAVDLFMTELIGRQALRVLYGLDQTVLQIADRYDKPRVFRDARPFDPVEGTQQ